MAVILSEDFLAFGVVAGTFTRAGFQNYYDPNTKNLVELTVDDVPAIVPNRGLQFERTETEWLPYNDNLAFDGAGGWTHEGVTVDSNAVTDTTFFRNLAADQVVEEATLGVHRLYATPTVLPAGKFATVSGLVRPSTDAQHSARNKLRFAYSTLAGLQGVLADFDLAALTVNPLGDLGLDLTLQDALVFDLGDGWRFIYISLDIVNSGLFQPFLQLLDDTGNPVYLGSGQHAIDVQYLSIQPNIWTHTFIRSAAGVTTYNRTAYHYDVPPAEQIADDIDLTVIFLKQHFTALGAGPGSNTHGYIATLTTPNDETLRLYWNKANVRQIVLEQLSASAGDDASTAVTLPSDVGPANLVTCRITKSSEGLTLDVNGTQATSTSQAARTPFAAGIDRVSLGHEPVNDGIHGMWVQSLVLENLEQIIGGVKPLQALTNLRHWRVTRQMLRRQQRRVR